MRRPIVLLALMAFWAMSSTNPAVASTQTGGSQVGNPLSYIAERTDGMEKIDGFVPLYWDARTGKIWSRGGRLGAFDT